MIYLLISPFIFILIIVLMKASVPREEIDNLYPIIYNDPNTPEDDIIVVENPDSIK